MKLTGLLGRWQVLGDKPKVVCDTAHNKEGLSLVLNQIQKEEYDTLHIVLGFVKDKNLDLVLPLFPKSALYYFCKPDIQRGLDAITLQKEAAISGLIGDVYASVGIALAAAEKRSISKDFVFIGGSNFVVAEVV